MRLSGSKTLFLCSAAVLLAPSGAQATDLPAKAKPVEYVKICTQAAMEISIDPTKLHALDRMTWWIRKWNRDVILIGDRPLLTYPRQKYPCGIPLDSRDCLIVLPIAPNAVFFACANPKSQTKMRRMALSRLANLANQETIFRATCIYASDGSHAKFISPRLEGKILGTWHP